MKNCISIILTAAIALTLTACTAAPDPAPPRHPHAGANGSARSPHACPRCRRFLHPEKLQRLL